MPRVRLTKQHRRSEALLLRKVPYGDSDLIVNLLTEQDGAISAIARRARKSAKRFGAVEPLHTLMVEYDVTPSREMATLTAAQLCRPRLPLTHSLAKMDAAGQALRWTRRVATRGHPEPALWHLLNGLLDDLMDCDDAHTKGQLGRAGLVLLESAGWGLQLRECVRCGKACPDNARVRIDVSAGGIVCRACGGTGVAVRAAERTAWFSAMADGAGIASESAAELAVDLVERALDAHGRGEAT